MLHIIARGRIGRGPEAELVNRYLKRVQWPTRITELSDVASRLPPVTVKARCVMLDERGQTLSSRGFADLIGQWRDDGVRETRLLIGAADGFTSRERDEADMLWSFGQATWPHLLVRAMVAEQLFRATSILAGHPYHREG